MTTRKLKSLAAGALRLARADVAQFKPKTVAVAVAAALMTSVAVAQVVIPLIKDAANPANMRTDLTALKTYIYPTTTTTGADYNGYLLIDVVEGAWPPGLRSYTVPFKSKGTELNGCLMVSLPPDHPIEETCEAEPGAGKRFKLHALKQNVAFDLVWDLDPASNAVGGEDSGKGSSQTDTSGIIRYKVFGKLVNETATGATGFHVRLGTGTGNAFKASSATDFLKLNPPVDLEKAGKFPGGMFGGSVSEGLPFFNTERAGFDVIMSGDTMTSGPMPKPYTDLFGPSWLRLADVPDAWWFEVDGKPWTKPEIWAWYDRYADGFADGWWTMTKSWTSTDRNVILAAFNTTPTGQVIVFDSTNVPDELFPPAYEFANIEELTKILNQLTGRTGLDPEASKKENKAWREMDVVEAFLPHLVLTRNAVSDADRATWASRPVTLRFHNTWAGTNPSYETAAAWPVVATWAPHCQYTDPAYVYTNRANFSEYEPYILAEGYQKFWEIDAISRKGVKIKCGNEPEKAVDILRVEDVRTIVKNNTGTATDVDAPGNPDTDYFAVPGYYAGPLDDVAKVNMFNSIALNKPLIGGTTQFTLGYTIGTPKEPTVLDRILAPIGLSGGGCSIGGSGPVDPTLPALLAAALAVLGWRRRRA